MKRFTRHFVEQKDIDSLKYDKVDEKPTPYLKGEDWKKVLTDFSNIGFKNSGSKDAD